MPTKSKVSSTKRTGQRKVAQQSTAVQPWMWIAGVVLLVAAVAVYMLVSNPSGSNPASAQMPAEIAVAEAYQMYQEGAFVLDVRTPEEWVEYHAPNTTLIPLDELPARLAEIPTDQQIVVVCRSGNRSQEGRDILKNAGFENVTSMAGGLKAWQTAGYPITTGQ